MTAAPIVVILTAFGTMKKPPTIAQNATNKATITAAVPISNVGFIIIFWCMLIERATRWRSFLRECHVLLHPQPGTPRGCSVPLASALVPDL